MPDLIKNKKLKRAADYTLKDQSVIKLYTWEGDRDDDMVPAGIATREVAHEWLHGNERRGLVPATDPTVDEMIDAVADQLKREMAHYMEWALDNEAALHAMYRVSKSPTNSVGGPPGMFRLTRAQW